MKRILLLMILALMTVSIWAEKIDGIYYNLTDGSTHTAEVTSGTSKYTGTISIPSTVRYNNYTYSVTSIGSYAFYDCSSLTSVTIAESVTSIGSYAFCGCSSLTSINIPNSVTSIGSFAFHNCSKLTSINIPNGVTSIGDGAFSWCSGLTSITIPEGVTSIGNDAFSDCSKLTSITIPNSVTSIGNGAFAYCSKLTSITIPESVTSIGSYAFEYCSSLTSINIPNGVTSIGDGAFEYCSSLTSITIPEGVTSIGNDAFSDCSKLTSITIPESVTSIDSYAFRDCSSLTSVNIPEGVTSIGSYAFSWCSSLTSITIPEGVTSIEEGVFYECSGLTSVTIPNSVTSIKYNAFSGCSNVKDLIYADGCTTTLATGLTSITSVTIPGSVTSIDSCAFYNYSNLAKIYTDSKVSLPEKLSSSIPLYTSREYFHDVIEGNKEFKVFVQEGEDLLVPVKLNYLQYNCGIKANGFVGDYTLVSMIERTIKFEIDNHNVILYINGFCYNDTIKTKKFADCPFNPSEYHKNNAIDILLYLLTDDNYFIADVDTPGTLINLVDISKINNCGKLKVSGNLNGTDILVIRRMENLISLDMREARIVNGGNSYYEQYTTSEDVFGDYLLDSKNKLVEVTLPNGLKSIGKYAFRNCASLKSVTIPNSVESIGTQAFDRCSGLTSVNISCKDELDLSNYVQRTDIESVFHIDELSGKSHTVLVGGMKQEQLVIPSSVTSIGDYAFHDCNYLTSVTIGRSVASIGPNSFGNCPKVRKLTYADGCITTLRTGLTSITSVTIPNSVISIGEDAFSGCSGIASVNVSCRDEEDFCNYVQRTDIESVFHIDELSGKSHTVLVDGMKQEQLVIPSSVTSIGDYAFHDCNYLTSVTIGRSVARIGYYAFLNCSSMTSVTIPNSVKSIGSGAFEGCTNLTSVHISDIAAWCKIQFGAGPSNPLYYAHHLYLNAEEIKDLVIPDSVIYIESNAFCGCSCLTSITIPNSVKSIGSGAFRDCTNLTSVHISDIAAWCRIFFYGVYGDISNPLYYAHHLYLNGEEIKDLIIPNGVTTIKQAAFYECSGLTSVVIPNSVTIIGESAFASCTGLTSIEIPNSVTSIRRSAFAGCSGLTSVTIGNSVTSIGSYAFENCKNLRQVVSMNTTPPEIDPSVFSGLDYSSCELIVPSESVALYWIHPYWEKFQNIRGVDNINDYITEIAIEEVTPTTSSSVMYDLSGRRISKAPQHGIHIHNGKKFIRL